MKNSSTSHLTFHPATPSHWADLEELFGPSGADGGCWCMFWRQTNADAAGSTPSRNRALLKSQIDSGISPGLLAYIGRQAVGWCGVGPRVSFARLEHTRHFQKATTDKQTWTIVCLFVDSKARKQGVASGLIKASVEYAVAHGADVVEAYPVKSLGKSLPAKVAYPGTVPMFVAAGFKEITVTDAKSRSGGFFRSIVRYDA